MCMPAYACFSHAVFLWILLIILKKSQ
jgi:hypothetical protein